MAQAGVALGFASTHVHRRDCGLETTLSFGVGLRATHVLASLVNLGPPPPGGRAEHLFRVGLRKAIGQGRPSGFKNTIALPQQLSLWQRHHGTADQTRLVGRVLVHVVPVPKGRIPPKGSKHGKTQDPKRLASTPATDFFAITAQDHPVQHSIPHGPTGQETPEHHEEDLPGPEGFPKGQGPPGLQGHTTQFRLCRAQGTQGFAQVTGDAFGFAQKLGGLGLITPREGSLALAELVAKGEQRRLLCLGRVRQIEGHHVQAQVHRIGLQEKGPGAGLGYPISPQGSRLLQPSQVLIVGGRHQLQHAVGHRTKGVQGRTIGGAIDALE